MTSARKLVLICLDACDRGLIAAHAADLPHISALLREGHLGELDAEPMSGGIWASFVTASRPEVHGIVHQLQWDPERMRMRCPGKDWLPPPPVLARSRRTRRGLRCPLRLPGLGPERPGGDELGRP